MLDAARARAEADAAERRGAGTLWGAGPVAWEGVTAGTVVQPGVVLTVEEEPGHADRALPRVATLRRAETPPATEEVPKPLLAAILARVQMAPEATRDVPAWLAEAVGNPLVYDAAAPHRKDVCARVNPALYRRLQLMKDRLGLRTTAGAWEYVLRAGLAASERGLGAAATNPPQAPRSAGGGTVGTVG